MGGEFEGRAGELRSPGPPLNISPKTDRGRLLALAAENAWAAFQRHRAKPIDGKPLEDLQARLHLAARPCRLECLDISTLQGSQSVGSLVVFTDGEPEKSSYRRFRIRGVAGQDDYAMLREVVQRHYGKEEQALPDLLVVDGGRGQLQVVLQALAELGRMPTAVVALAKAGRAGGEEVPDRLFLPGRKNPRMLPANSPGWLLLLHLRDEAHRFAISYHRQRARKEMLASALETVPGIGPARRKALLRHFSDLEAMKKATTEELAKLPGFNRPAAERLKEWI